jgi:phosphoribosylformylglycinamidine synthase
MSLADPDRELVEAELGRSPTRAEAALFENLWSEHCAYRSSQALLRAFETESDDVVLGPGDDAAVVALTDDTYVTFGIESHNHPSYVDPYDGAATGVGGIVRDTLSMGAFPIALADSLYFGDFDREHSRYLLDGVVDGISDYGNSIGVPTVTGSTQFHPDYVGNPLVNVACVGLLPADRLVTADAKQPGNALVLVGNATGRDGLGGASFASEDLAEDAETEDRPAVQVGDPYTEKLLIEANEELLDADVVVAARDLGAAGLGGASSEMAAKGDLGCHLVLDDVHQREPNMNAMEILLAESQERMCYEVAQADVETVEAVAEKYDLGCSVIGDVTDTGRYVCEFQGETVVDVPAEFVADGAPLNDLARAKPPEPATEVPDVDIADALDAIIGSPNCASKRWVYRQYDHEVGTRTAMLPGDDAAVLAIRESGADPLPAGAPDEVGVGLALSTGANPHWTTLAPYEGSFAIALENATNLAAKGATPLAAVDCLNGGNPENPDVYGAFAAAVDGLADGCAALSVPVVGGNVSLYNDSQTGPIPPTPTLAMLGTRDDYEAPGLALQGDADLVLVGGHDTALGGSELLAQFGGRDAFPALPDDPAALVDAITTVANQDSTLATHDVSDGGLAVTLAEMVTPDAGATVTVPDGRSLFSEAPGRVVVETTDVSAVTTALDGVADVVTLGESEPSGALSVSVGGEQHVRNHDAIQAARDVLERELD